MPRPGNVIHRVGNIENIAWRSYSTKAETEEMYGSKLDQFLTYRSRAITRELSVQKRG